MITPISGSKDATIGTWLIDTAGNVAISLSGLALLKRIQTLIIPVFVSTEEAMHWGSHLSPEQRATLLDIQRSVSNAAQTEADLQRMVNLATQSQLMREAAEAFPAVPVGKSFSMLFAHAVPRGKTPSRN